MVSLREYINEDFYDNSTTGIEADDYQEAIDVVATDLSNAINNKLKENVSVVGGSGAITLDLADGTVFTTTLSGNVSSLAFNNTPAADKAINATLVLTQDSTERTVNWDSILWTGNVEPSISTTNAAYIIDFLLIGSTVYGFLSGSEVS